MTSLDVQFLYYEKNFCKPLLYNNFVHVTFYNISNFDLMIELDLSNNLFLRRPNENNSSH